MKYLPTLLISLVLVACGGGDETPVAIINTSVPHPVANAATVTGGSAVAVHLYQALYGMAPSNATLIAHTAQATADPSTFARSLASNFASTSSAALAKLVLDNLGVTATTVTAVNGQGQSEYAILLDALGQMFTFYGVDARGQIILNATNLLAGLESDPTYGVTAVKYNNQSSVNFSYGSNTTNTVAAAISTTTANAGVEQNVIAGTRVTLDGSSSTAEAGKTLTYFWTLTVKPAGSAAVLSSATSVKPTFTADLTGTYVVSLRVSDGKLTSGTTAVRITASNTVPIANAGVAQSVVAGTYVYLDGSRSSDANGDKLTYAWTLTAKPAGSKAYLSSDSVRPTFATDRVGNYVATLVVSDGMTSSAPMTVNIAAVRRFYKVDSAGNLAEDSAGSWPCVIDTSRGGLMWEVKDDDGGLRDKDWVYTSYSSIGTNGNGVCDSAKTCNVFKFRDAVNLVGLCGHKDWRLPGVYELESLRDRNQSQAPYIDTQYFPFTRSARYWCDDGSWSTGSPYIWLVDFSNAQSYSTRFRDFQYHVRLVRTLTR